MIFLECQQQFSYSIEYFDHLTQSYECIHHTNEVFSWISTCLDVLPNYSKFKSS